MILGLLALLTTASAGSDAWSSTIGAQWVQSRALATSDLDFILGQRLSWTLSESPAFTSKALVNARFTIDPATTSQSLERARVSTLATALTHDRWTLTVGRAPVYKGGPRLVDGLQGLIRTPSGLELGAWAGLAPDLFTTLPRLRPGGGPIVAWTRSQVQLSTVGELLYAAGGLDRAGLLTQGRYAPGPGLAMSARVDLQIADADGRGGLADGSIAARVSPGDLWRTDVLYDAYSSLRYQTTSQLDPRLRRFSSRIENLGLTQGITQDTPDTSLHQLFSVDNRLRAAKGTVHPMLGLRTRYRHHTDPANRYGRLQPRAGVDGLVDDRLSIAVDASVLWIDTAVQQDLGLTTYFDLLPSGDLSVDASARLLLDPDDYGARPGYYTDGYLQGVVAQRVVWIAGLSLEHEPFGDFEDVAIGAFAQVSTRVRRADKDAQTSP